MDEINLKNLLLDFADHHLMFTGRVAQLVERQSNKLPVEGSSPFVTIFIIKEHNDHSHTHFPPNIVIRVTSKTGPRGN